MTARCLGAGGNEAKAQEARDGKEDLRVLGDPKEEAEQSLCHTPSPDPPQPNHLPQPPGYGRELGKTTKPISSRNVHLQLEANEHPRCPSSSLLSGPARRLESHRWWSQNAAPGPSTVTEGSYFSFRYFATVPPLLPFIHK